jgi:lactate permease
MAFFVWAMARLGAAQIASVVPGLVGCGVAWLFLRRRRPAARIAARAATPVGAAQNPRRPMSFHLAFLPYYLLIALTVLSQLPPVKEATGHLAWGLDYPAVETSLGYQVKKATNYAAIGLFRHPAPMILAAAFLTFAAFRALGRWRRGAAWAAARATYRQSLPTSVGVATMVAMALVMIDTGMTQVLARGVADVTGVAFPFFSPYIGVLGTFLTGSNTNSNVMFGALQTETARALGLSTVTLASAQSIGGSLGSSIAPAKVLVGTALVGLQGREASVMRKAIPYCLALVALVGVEVWIVSYLL